MTTDITLYDLPTLVLNNKNKHWSYYMVLHDTNLWVSYQNYSTICGVQHQIEKNSGREPQKFSNFYSETYVK